MLILMGSLGRVVRRRRLCFGDRLGGTTPKDFGEVYACELRHGKHNSYLGLGRLVWNSPLAKRKNHVTQSICRKITTSVLVIYKCNGGRKVVKGVLCMWVEPVMFRFL